MPGIRREENLAGPRRPSWVGRTGAPAKNDSVETGYRQLNLRRNREEIPGSFGQCGNAVRDVVGAGPNSRSGSGSDSASPRGENDSNSCAETPGATDRVPRVEFFAGGSYAEAGLFNAGHWAGLPGWDSSFGLNVSPWLGLVVEGGQYFGTSKIPVSVPEPFPTCPPFCPQSSRHSTYDKGIQHSFWRPICPSQI